MTPWEAFGGNFAVSAILPFGRVAVSAGVELDSPRTNTIIGRSLRDKATIVGDPVLSATLGWHSGKFHWSTTALVNVPVGDYRDGQLANLAFHRWASDLTGALTWFDPETGIDLSTAVGVTFNGTNHATDYRTGTEFHVEWAASKSLTSALSAGVIGYHYQQVTGDSGSAHSSAPIRGGRPHWMERSRTISRSARRRSRHASRCCGNSTSRTGRWEQSACSPCRSP